MIPSAEQLAKQTKDKLYEGPIGELVERLRSELATASDKGDFKLQFVFRSVENGYDNVEALAQRLRAKGYKVLHFFKGDKDVFEIDWTPSGHHCPRCCTSPNLVYC